MTQATAQTVLRRKAEAGRPKVDAVPMTAARAFTTALAKSAQDLMNMPLRVAEINETRMTLAELPEVLEALSLLAVMEGPGEGLGLIALPPATLSALIEVQTMGRIAPTMPAPRKATRIDASMAADLIDAVMEGFEDLLAEAAEISWAGGFRYASFLDDPRPLGLLLEDISFRVYQIKLLLGPSGEREGGLFLALPAIGRGPGPRKAPENAVDPITGLGVTNTVDPAIEADWTERIEQAVSGARVDLNAVLHRVTLSLAQVTELKVGMTIPVPYAALEDLLIEGIGRRRVGAARLGQAQGLRALRIRIDDEGEAEDAADRAFASHAAQRGGAHHSSKPAEDPAELPQIGNIPPMGGLPNGALPALDDLPALGDFPEIDDLPALKIGGM